MDLSVTTGATLANDTIISFSEYGVEGLKPVVDLCTYSLSPEKFGFLRSLEVQIVALKKLCASGTGSVFPLVRERLLPYRVSETLPMSASLTASQTWYAKTNAAKQFVEILVR